MKKYKRFLMPLIVVVLLISMALPSYASQYISLFDLLGDTTLFGFREYVNSDGLITRVGANATWSQSTDGAINVGPNPNGYASTAVGFGSDSLLGSDTKLVSKNDILIFNCDSLSMFQISNPSGSTSTINLTVTVEFYDINGIARQVVVFDGAPYSATTYSAYFRWQFEYEIPSTYEQLTAIYFHFSIPSSNFSNFAFYSNYLTFFVGSRSDAPIYGGADKSYLDDLKAQEDQLRAQTSHGVSEVDGIFENLNGILTPASDMGEGAIAVTALLTPLFGMEPLDDILIISLAVGLIMFIIGTISTIHGSISASRRHTESAAYRESKGQYYREMINYYRNKRG